MAGMSVDGLVSGLDTTSLIAKLVQAEGAAQASLKTRLSVAQAAATAYRSVNTRFDALRAAAQALVKPGGFDPTKFTSTGAGVTATKDPTAPLGSATFDVTALAATHTVRSAAAFTSTTVASGVGTLDVRDASGNIVGSIKNGKGTVQETIDAINASTFGLTAKAVELVPGEVRIQVTAAASGAARAFTLEDSAKTGTEFTVATQGADASVTVGSGSTARTLTSSTNVFTGLLTGVTVRVSALVTGAAVSVVSDPDGVAGRVQALVDAANAALSGIKTYSDAKGGPVAVLKGDGALRRLAGQILDSVSTAVGADGSAAVAGLQLSKDGTLTFDKATFLKALEADPAKVQRILGGGPAADGAVPGVAQRLLERATAATDSTTGSLTLLANGRDRLGKDFQQRIEAWDLRLAARRNMLTRQFSAMESALGSLRNQSSWLSGQLGSLPSGS